GRALAAGPTGVVEAARGRHGTYPTATAALGRTLTGALLLGGTMKDEERLSIELVGDRTLRRATAERARRRRAAAPRDGVDDGCGTGARLRRQPGGAPALQARQARCRGRGRQRH